MTFIEVWQVLDKRLTAYILLHTGDQRIRIESKLHQLVFDMFAWLNVLNLSSADPLQKGSGIWTLPLHCATTEYSSAFGHECHHFVASNPDLKICASSPTPFSADSTWSEVSLHAGEKDDTQAGDQQVRF